MPAHSAGMDTAGAPEEVVDVAGVDEDGAFVEDELAEVASAADVGEDESFEADELDGVGLEVLVLVSTL